MDFLNKFMLRDDCLGIIINNIVLVLVLSTFWDLINAVGIGLVIASLIFMKKMGDGNLE